MSLPAHVQTDVQRILDAAARRLLAEKLKAQPNDLTPTTEPGLQPGLRKEAQCR
jgi:hypothetical protein